MEPENNEAPSWFKIVAAFMLVWNLLGLMAFFLHLLITPEQLAQLPTAEQALYQNTPVWATMAFAVAVLAGCLGCLALLFGKQWAIPLFIASLLGVVLQNIHAFMLIDSYSVYGAEGLIMPSIVSLLGIFLLCLSVHAKRQHWLD